ncbi:MAG: hypothetical protein E3J28_03315 [Desulfobacteraceae bacterium]|nr:MAG: hypothetical protein E3J28_03315 [Desulfobacteraceae bacterium]
MKRIFELEFDDDLGPLWMNKDNLASCLFSETHISNVKIGIRDITNGKQKAKSAVQSISGCAVVGCCYYDGDYCRYEGDKCAYKYRWQPDEQ